VMTWFSPGFETQRMEIDKYRLPNQIPFEIQFKTALLHAYHALELWKQQQDQPFFTRERLVWTTGLVTTIGAAAVVGLRALRKWSIRHRFTPPTSSAVPPAAAPGKNKPPAASSPLDSVKNPGGIDLNPNNLNLQTQGKSFDFQLPLDSIDLQNIRIDGFTPVIINVAPLTNLPLLLGLVEEAQDTENVRITPGRDPMDHRMEYDEEIAS